MREWEAFKKIGMMLAMGQGDDAVEELKKFVRASDMDKLGKFYLSKVKGAPKHLRGSENTRAALIVEWMIAEGTAENIFSNEITCNFDFKDLMDKAAERKAASGNVEQLAEHSQTPSEHDKNFRALIEIGNITDALKLTRNAAKAEADTTRNAAKAEADTQFNTSLAKAKAEILERYGLPPDEAAAGNGESNSPVCPA